MSALNEMSAAELTVLIQTLEEEYQAFKAQGLHLSMARGKPAPEQLDLLTDMYYVLNSDNVITDEGIDARNYGNLDGLPEAKKLFAKLLDVEPEQVIIGGNSSLNMMYDLMLRAMYFGVLGSKEPWSKAEGGAKFLCPVPGYDRHFSVCEALGLKMINIPMRADGPDMDLIERLVAADASIKGVWCVPQYSNPQGITYSDEVVERFAKLKPAASDFRIFWDNAYFLHTFRGEPARVKNIISECEKAGNPNLVYEFASTSKITFPGAGVALVAASTENIAFIKSQMQYQTISADKMNQLRHVLYLRDERGVADLMKKHAKLIEPKFELVLSKLADALGESGVAKWENPDGGYFISLDVMDGCAGEIIAMAAGAGVELTPAGSAFPYHQDPNDSNIRIAPTFPNLEELEKAADLLCVCVKLVCARKLLAAKQSA